mmetsp:Transcript_4337/g.8055  ORF Transcript_4337/g.8055 Transcript_4337/m.8055 type:complete len:248 (-) Transcript_4337:12-755(-)
MANVQEIASLTSWCTIGLHVFWICVTFPEGSPISTVFMLVFALVTKPFEFLINPNSLHILRRFAKLFYNFFMLFLTNFLNVGQTLSYTKLISPLKAYQARPPTRPLHITRVGIALPLSSPLQTPKIIVHARLAIPLLDKFCRPRCLHHSVASIAGRGAVKLHVGRIVLACSVFGPHFASFVLVHAFDESFVVFAVVFVVSPIFDFSIIIFAVVVPIFVRLFGACTIGIVGGGAHLFCFIGGIDAVDN